MKVTFVERILVAGKISDLIEGSIALIEGKLVFEPPELEEEFGRSVQWLGKTVRNPEEFLRTLPKLYRGSQYFAVLTENDESPGGTSPGGTEKRM
jgi:hypothetical protein